MNKIPENTPKLYEAENTTISRLLQRHLRILDLHLEGKRDSEIAKIVGLLPRRIKAIRNSPCFEHELTRRRMRIEDKHTDAVVASALIKTDAQQVLDEEAVNAAQELVGGLISDDDGVRFKSAESILDRTGYGKQTKVDSRVASVVTTISAEQMATIAETLQMIQKK